jgi:signal transduction histidine kinase
MFECLHSPDEYEGTGIGLALVKKAVALHRGVVSVESVVGEGSVFSIVLPRRLQDRHPAPPD